MPIWSAGATGALLSYGTTQLLADRTMASAIGNASRRAIAAGMHPASSWSGVCYHDIVITDSVYSNRSADPV